jgi:hypothetical protein
MKETRGDILSPSQNERALAAHFVGDDENKALRQALKSRESLASRETAEEA